MNEKELADLVNKIWRLVAYNCKGNPELVRGLCLVLLEKSLSDVSPKELRKAILKFNQDCPFVPASRKSA